MRKIYVLDTEKTDIDYINCSDEEFITECEEQGRVYEDLEGFVKDFNDGRIITWIDQIREIFVK